MIFVGLSVKICWSGVFIGFGEKEFCVDSFFLFELWQALCGG